MRGSVTPVAKVEPGQPIDHEIASLERDDRITPATFGLSIAEGKAMGAAIRAAGPRVDHPSTLFSLVFEILPNFRWTAGRVGHMGYAG